MKTDKQRMQQIANALKGLSVKDALQILRSVKCSIKYQATVNYDKDYFTKEPEQIKFAYRIQGALEHLLDSPINNPVETPK